MLTFQLCVHSTSASVMWVTLSRCRRKAAVQEVLVALADLYAHHTVRLSAMHHPDGRMHVGASIVSTPREGLWVVATPR